MVVLVKIYYDHYVHKLGKECPIYQKMLWTKCCKHLKSREAGLYKKFLINRMSTCLRCYRRMKVKNIARLIRRELIINNTMMMPMTMMSNLRIITRTLSLRQTLAKIMFRMIIMGGSVRKKLKGKAHSTRTITRIWMIRVAATAVTRFRIRLDIFLILKSRKRKAAAILQKGTRMRMLARRNLQNCSLELTI